LCYNKGSVGGLNKKYICKKEAVGGCIGLEMVKNGYAQNAKGKSKNFPLILLETKKVT